MSEEKLLEEILKSSLSSDTSDTLESQFKQRLDELEISLNQAESWLGITKKSLSNIFDGTAKTLSVTNLLKIGDFLGYSSTRQLLQAYVGSLSQEAIADLERANRAKYIVENFDLAGLKEVGFISQNKDFDEIESRVRSFFGLESIFDYDTSSKSKGNPNQKMISFWLASAREYFKKLNNPNDYDRKALVNVVGKIKPYCQDDKRGLITVAQALFKVGVTVVYQPYIPNTHIRGATMVVDGKPCIIITDLRKNYGTLWFALMHELFHVLYDLENIEAMSSHVTDEASPDLLVNEYRADEFARNYFFGPESIAYIKPFIGNHVLVKRQAEKHQIHHSIIYNNFAWEMQRQKKNYWPLATKYSPKIDDVLQGFNRSLWEWESIAKEAVDVRETLYSLKTRNS